MHRETFPEELRVPRHLDIHTVAGQLPCPTAEFRRGAHRHRRLADNHRRPGQPGHEFVDDRVHMAQIGSVLTLLLRCADAEEVNVGEVSRQPVVGAEL